MFINNCVNTYFMLSLLLIVTLTLVYPIPTSIGITNYVASNYKPFFVIKSLLKSNSFLDCTYNIIGNIMLFIPLGLILPLKFKRINKFGKAVFVGFIFSVFIELTQLLMPYRQTDIDDIILNTLGTGLGYGIYKLWLKKSDICDF